MDAILDPSECRKSDVFFCTNAAVENMSFVALSANVVPNRLPDSAAVTASVFAEFVALVATNEDRFINDVAVDRAAKDRDSTVDDEAARWKSCRTDC